MDLHVTKEDRKKKRINQSILSTATQLHCRALFIQFFFLFSTQFHIIIIIIIVVFGVQQAEEEKNHMCQQASDVAIVQQTHRTTSGRGTLERLNSIMPYVRSASV